MTFKRLSGPGNSTKVDSALPSLSQKPTSGGLAEIDPAYIGVLSAIGKGTADRKKGLMTVFQEKGDARIARREAQEKREQEERLKREFEAGVRERIKAQSRLLTLRIATVLDYTASTIGDVRGFVAEIEKLLQMLRAEFAVVEIIPVAVSGHYNDYRIPYVYIADPGEEAYFYRSRAVNSAYQVPTPVGQGIIEIADRFNQEAFNALVAISDSYFEIFPDHPDAMRKLLKADVGTISLTSNYADTHVEAFTPLGQNAVVVDRRNPHMDPVQLIFEFIMNRVNALFQIEAEAYVRAQMARQNKPVQDSVTMGPVVGFREHLRLKGHASEADNVLAIEKK